MRCIRIRGNVIPIFCRHLLDPSERERPLLNCVYLPTMSMKPVTFVKRSGLGSAQMQMGQYDNAVGFYLKSLEIKRKVWGFNHAKTALTYMGLGSKLYA